MYIQYCRARVSPTGLIHGKAFIEKESKEDGEAIR